MVLASSQRPTSLTIDVSMERLYWLDVQDSAIWRCTIDGNSISKLLTSSQGSFFNGLAIYGVWKIDLTLNWCVRNMNVKHIVSALISSANHKIYCISDIPSSVHPLSIIL